MVCDGDDFAGEERVGKDDGVNCLNFEIPPWRRPFGPMRRPIKLASWAMWARFMFRIVGRTGKGQSSLPINKHFTTLLKGEILGILMVARRGPLL